MLKLFPQNTVVAELGVDREGFSEQILKICNPRKLYLVDVWASERYSDEKASNVLALFEDEIKKQKIFVKRMLSTEAASTFKDDYFDQIYIDTDHSYQTTLEELYLYALKVKAGGYMAGHDYVICNWVDH